MPRRPTPIEDLLEHTGFVRNLARGALGRDDGTDDIAQDAWVAAIEDGPRDPKAARGWFYRVVRNRIAGVKRRDATHAKSVDRMADRPSVPQPHEILEREDTRRRMVGVLLALDPMYREPLVLRYYEDLPPREIAKRLDMPVETVRTRLRRGIERLRADLDSEYGSRRGWAVAALPLLRLPASPAATGGWLTVAAPLAAIGTVLALSMGIAGWIDEPAPGASVARSSPTQPPAATAPALATHPLARTGGEAPESHARTTESATRRIVLTVVDYDNRPVPDAHVRVAQAHYAGAREATSGTTDADGRFSMPHVEVPDPALQLPTQKYLLWIRQPRTREDLRDHDARDWRPATSTIALKRGYVVAGDVVDAAGRALPGVTLTLNGQETDRTTRADARGSFRFTGLPPGRWQTRVAVRAMNPEARDAQWQLESGTQRARLEVPVDGELLPVQIQGYNPKTHDHVPMCITESDPQTNAITRTVTYSFGTHDTMLLCGLLGDRTYSFWWGPDKHNMYALATNVIATATPFTLPIKPGSFLWIQVEAPDGWAWPRITVTASGIKSPANFHSEFEVDGRRTRVFGVSGLPQGEYEVHAIGRNENNQPVEGWMRARTDADNPNVLTLSPK